MGECVFVRTAVTYFSLSDWWDRFNSSEMQVQTGSLQAGLVPSCLYSNPYITITAPGPFFFCLIALLLLVCLWFWFWCFEQIGKHRGESFRDKTK